MTAPTGDRELKYVFLRKRINVGPRRSECYSGVSCSNRLWIYGPQPRSQPHLSRHLTGLFECSPDQEVAERLHRYAFSLGAVAPRVHRRAVRRIIFAAIIP